MKSVFLVFINRKKRNLFRPARWGARNPAFLLIMSGASQAKHFWMKICYLQ